MSDVSSVTGASHAHHAHEVRSRDAIAREATTPASSTRAADQVELSSASIERSRQLAGTDEPIRLGLVQDIRDQIRAGTYDSESRITLASDALARALASD